MKKNIVITGCSRGIGYQTLKQLAEQGHHIFALSRNTQPVQHLSMPNIQPITFDISDNNDIEKIAQLIKNQDIKIDILIHNAGKLINKPFDKLSYYDFLDVYNVNVFGVASLTQKLLPFMNHNAHIVAISSMGGIQGSVKFPGLAAYSSSKGAVITLMELLAEEYKHQNIKFNTLALGAVQTEMLNEAFPDFKAPVSATEMGAFVVEFALKYHHLFNGKTLQVACSTP